MEQEQLRAIQTSLKEKYRKDPSAALLTIRATRARLDSDRS
jgi:hypothetical protein